MDTLNRILNLLQERGIEQQEFANAIGLKKYVISEWKSGKTNSYLKYIDRIAEYFNVTADYLLGKTDKKSPPAPGPGDITLDDFTYAMHNEAKELTEAQKDQLLAMARFFKSELEKEKEDK